MKKEFLANATLAFEGDKKAKQKVQDLEYEREELLKAIDEQKWNLIIKLKIFV
jgi:hypothetical protein